MTPTCSRSMPPWARNRCWHAASPNARGCAFRGMASRSAYAPCSASRSASPPPLPLRGVWWMRMGRICRACRPSSIASSQRPRCWPRPLESIGLPRSRVRALAAACASGQLDFGPGPWKTLLRAAWHCPASARAVHRPARARPPRRRPCAWCCGHARPQRLSERATEARSQPWRRGAPTPCCTCGTCPARSLENRHDPVV